MANLTGGIYVIFRGLNLTEQRRVRRKTPFSDGNYLTTIEDTQEEGYLLAQMEERMGFSSGDIVTINSTDEVKFEKMNIITTVNSISYFVLAGLFEIGGGYLVWLWLRVGKSIFYGLTGAFVLMLYGVVPTFQPAHFGRVYAAYGGVFIVMSILWGWKVDKMTPDKFDIIGGLVALIGVGIIMYWPRSH